MKTKKIVIKSYIIKIKLISRPYNNFIARHFEIKKTQKQIS